MQQDRANVRWIPVRLMASRCQAQRVQPSNCYQPLHFLKFLNSNAARGEEETAVAANSAGCIVAESFANRHSSRFI